jgi:REP element-mobilizing transposase RayT
MEFVERLRSIKERDGWVVLAWCVMANHYHLAVRRSTVDLAVSLHALQGRFGRSFNRGAGRSGGVWQSRYHAKLIDEQRYLSRVILYVHLNPVRAGVVTDPSGYVFSGHREIVRRSPRPLIDPEHALLCFDETRRAARRSYLAAMRAGAEELVRREQTSEDGTDQAWWRRMPWWEEDDEALEPRDPEGPRLGAERLERRPAAADLLSVARKVLELSREDLNGRSRARDVATKRRLVATVLLERWGVPRRELAEELERNPEVVSHWAAEARSRRREDPGFAKQYATLDKALQARFHSAEDP